jgi:PadR family transcriptional regulator, regulatory protein PadR
MALLKGTLEVLVLKTLSWGAKHGVEIVTALEERSGGRLPITDAALLQALQRLEARDLVSAEMGATANNRQARYYRLTPAGRAYLKAQQAALADDIDALTSVLNARSAKG